MRILVAVLLLSLCAACTPGPVRTQIDFLELVISTGVEEAEAAPDVETRADIAVRALQRARLHAESLKAWVEGKVVDAD